MTYGSAREQVHESGRSEKSIVFGEAASQTAKCMSECQRCKQGEMFPVQSDLSGLASRLIYMSVAVSVITSECSIVPLYFADK